MLQHIWALEGEREARGQEATEAAQRHAQALEQVKLRDMAAADLQKKVPPPPDWGTLGHTWAHPRRLGLATLSVAFSLPASMPALSLLCLFCCQ